MFQESSKGVQVRLKGISSIFKGVSRAFERRLTGVSGKCQGCFKEVSKKFQGSYKGVSWKLFQESFKSVSRKIEGCFNWVFNWVQCYLKDKRKRCQEYFGQNETMWYNPMG